MKITLFVLTVTAIIATASLRAEDKAQPAPAPAAKPAATADHKPDEAVARVGAKTIPWKDLDAAVNAVSQQFERNGRSIPAEKLPELRHDILEEMITRELVLQDASGHEPTNVEQRVKEQLDTITQRVGGNEALDKALAETGLTRADYLKRLRESVVVQESLQAYVDQQVKVTPEDAKAFYSSNPDKFKRPESVRASHILITVPADADERVKKDKRAQIDAARSLVKNGDKFADVAKKYSEDPVSARNGGDLGYFSRGQMVPEFETVAFTLKLNELSDVITTKFGYHVLQVTDKKPAGDVPFDEAKEKIEAFLKNQKGSAIAQAHLKDLREKGKVEVLLKESVPAAASQLPTVETQPVAAPKP